MEISFQVYIDGSDLVVTSYPENDKSLIEDKKSLQEFGLEKFKEIGRINVPINKMNGEENFEIKVIIDYEDCAVKIVPIDKKSGKKVDDFDRYSFKEDLGIKKDEENRGKWPGHGDIRTWMISDDQEVEQDELE